MFDVPFDIEGMLEVLHEVELEIRGSVTLTIEEARRHSVNPTSSRRSKPSALLWLFIVLNFRPLAWYQYVMN